MTESKPKANPGRGIFPVVNRTIGLDEPARRLSTIRDAVVTLAEHGITHEQIRRWIHQGAGGHKLPTHHIPGRADATLVDINEVLGFHRRLQQGRIRGPRKPHPSQHSFSISKDRVQAFHDLANAYARKLGISSVTIPDAVWMAVQQELRRLA